MAVDKDQRVISLVTSQVSHGWVNAPSNGGKTEVIVGYAPSMIRLVVVGTAAVLSRLYWYSTDPGKVVKMVDSSDGNGCAIVDAPLEATDRGFVLDFDSGGLLETATRVIWEAFGSEPSEAIPQGIPNPYSMPGEDVDDDYL